MNSTLSGTILYCHLLLEDTLALCMVKVTAAQLSIFSFLASVATPAGTVLGRNERKNSRKYKLLCNNIRRSYYNSFNKPLLVDTCN
jgi:hypothetical protein